MSEAEGVFRYLDLSTGHLPEAEFDAVAGNLSNLDIDGPRIIRHDYGAWVNVPAGWGPDETLDLTVAYPNLAACIEHARTVDCQWINFDQDGNRIAALPVFDW